MIKKLTVLVTTLSVMLLIVLQDINIVLGNYFNLETLPRSDVQISFILVKHVISLEQNLGTMEKLLQIVPLTMMAG